VYNFAIYTLGVVIKKKYTYRKRISVRKNSICEGMIIPLKTIVKILIRWSCDQPRYSILKTINVSKDSLRFLLKRLIKCMRKEENENFVKLGGHGHLVNIDETMLNYKCKSHRGRSATNRTDALCIV
jgi:hypothetical protein